MTSIAPSQGPPTQSPLSKSSILLKSSLMGILRGVIGLPLQHPFDTIKTNMQAYQTDLQLTIKRIYQNKGIRGFYSGFVINTVRVVSRQFYRWPLQIGLFGYYTRVWGDKLNRATLGIICGANIAIIQVVIICPFERLKVWLMTAKDQSKMSEFFKKFKIRALFDGMLPVLIKQTIAWTTFLGATQYFKQVAYRYSKKDRMSQKLSTQQILIISCLAAIVNTLFVMPIDCIKTHYQKNQCLTVQKGKSKFLQTIKEIHRQFGIKGFFKGWQVKLVQYTINSVFMVVLFQNLLKEYQRTDGKKE